MAHSTLQALTARLPRSAAPFSRQETWPSPSSFRTRKKRGEGVLLALVSMNETLSCNRDDAPRSMGKHSGKMRDEIDEEFIIHAAGLYRCHTTLRTNGKDLREACKQYVSGVSHLIKNDKLCADVMAKILTPVLEPDWDFTEKFQDEMVLKLKAADAAAAAEDARNEVGYQMHHFMFATFLNLIENAVQFQKERSGRQKLQIAEKRSHSDLIES
ncbi:hypothetical protein EJB05_32624, partial [Eragrostis curvula]